MSVIPKIGGLPLLMNNAYYKSGDGTKTSNVVHDTDYVIVGPFDTGSTAGKNYTIKTMPMVTDNSHCIMRAFNDLSSNSFLYLGYSQQGQDTYSVTGFPGRYFTITLPKMLAPNFYMYDNTNKRYVCKGSNVIDVTWNQQAKAMTADGWVPYDATKVSTAFADGVCTMTWLVDGKGYSTGLRATNYPYTDVGHVMYVRYDVLPDRDGEWGAESGGGGMPVAVNCTANQWNAVRLQSAATKKAWARPIIANWRGSSSGTTGMEVQVRNPAWVNLSVMYGVGNEPTMEEFERQCVLNGIDLSTYQPEDAGTVRPWIISKAN